VYGGQSGDAFLALTGGCSEYIDFDDELEADAKGSKMSKTLAVFTRLRNACAQGEGMIATEVPVCCRCCSLACRLCIYSDLLNIFNRR